MRVIGYDRTTFDAARELRLALRRLTDLPWLQVSPLAQLSAVRELALRRYAGQPFADGRALRALLLETIVAVDQTLAAAPRHDDGEITQLRLALHALARGESIAMTARSLGLPPQSYASRLLYHVQHQLVRTFLERAGQMAPSRQVSGFDAQRTRAGSEAAVHVVARRPVGGAGRDAQGSQLAGAPFGPPGQVRAGAQP